MARVRTVPSLRRSAFFNVVGRAGSILVWILVTPYSLSRLGSERFGVWALYFAICGYASALDLGTSSSVSRFVARAAAEGKRDGVRSIVRRSLLISAATGGVWCLAAILLRSAFRRAFHVPDSLASEVDGSQLLFGVALIVFSMSQVLQGALVGFQRLDLSNLYFTIGLVLQATLLVVGLERGGGLLVAVASMLCGQLATAVLSMISVQRATRAVEPLAVDGRVGWRDLLGYSSAVQATNLFAIGQLQLGKVLLGLLGNLQGVTQYELGLRVANGAWSLPQLMQGPLIPAAAHRRATEGPQALADLYAWACRWGFALGGAVFGLLWLIAPALYLLWLGPGHDVAAAAARALAVAFSAALLLGPATAVARGGGWPLLETGALGAALVINLAAGWWLVRMYGPIGAALSTGIAYAVAAVGLLIALHRRLGIPSRSWWMTVAAPRFLFPTLAAGLAWWLTSEWPTDHRSAALLVLSAQTAAYVAALAVLSAWTGDTQVVWRRVAALGRSAAATADAAGGS